jgi:hypothetical protein
MTNENAFVATVFDYEVVLAVVTPDVPEKRTTIDEAFYSQITLLPWTVD